MKNNGLYSVLKWIWSCKTKDDNNKNWYNINCRDFKLLITLNYLSILLFYLHNIILNLILTLRYFNIFIPHTPIYTILR